MLAVIQTGAKQYLVSPGQTIEVELLNSPDKVEFKPLLVIDGDTTHVGRPTLDNATVNAKVVDASKKADKVTVLKYKPKKRIHTTSGHRQRHSVLEITGITL